jgi:hypothetical protein
MKIRKKIIALMISLIAIPTFAQSKEGKFSFGVDAGLAKADIGAEESARELSRLSGRAVSYSYEQSTLTGRVYVDYGINKDFSVELGYFRSASLDANYRSGADTAKESVTTKGYDLAAVYKPKEQGYFGKAGIHKSELDGQASITIAGLGTFTGSGSEKGNGWLVGAGYEGKIDDNMSWRAGITYYDSLGGLSSGDATFLYVGLKF